MTHSDFIAPPPLSDLSQRKPRVLYIHPGNVPPQLPPERNPTYHLSRYMDGDLVTVSWDDRAGYRRNRREYEEATGSFGYHPSLSSRLPSALQTLKQFLFLTLRSLWLSLRGGGYDAIVAYGPFKTAWAGAVVKLVTGAPLIVQIIGDPFSSLQHYESRAAKVKRRLARPVVRATLLWADRLHLLYPAQAEIFGDLRTPPSVSFPDFASTSLVPRGRPEEDFILFLGFPWKLKGVDILIQAFNRISERFPDARLKVVGHSPDRSPFEKLAAGNERIELLPGVLHPEAMDLMGRCRFFVLPSRSEAMGRVILEAWAAGKAVVASNVGGIPHLVRDGEDGLLFPSEDVEALASRLARLLEHPAEARRLGENGYQRVVAELNEEQYAQSFHAMIQGVIRGGRR